MSDLIRTGRRKNRRCVECGAEVKADDPWVGPARCEKHAGEHAEAQKQRREAIKNKGYCPQCGKVKLAKKEKSCLRCMLKVNEKDGDDFVGPIVKSRNWAKRLKES
jgi:hypothetical protein